MDRISRFIHNFKKGFNEKQLEDVFTNGNCYHFALILEQIFSGEIIYDPHEFHFSTRVNNKFYDITGEIEKPMDLCIWEEMEETDCNEYLILTRDCVYKN